MSLTLLFVAAALSAPAPSVKHDGWSGQMVMLKRAAVSYRFAQKGGENNGSLMMIEYRVLKDKGDDLLLIENGKEVLVRKEEMVLQAEAVAHYTEILEKESNDTVMYAFRGWANKQRKSLDAALADYDKAVELAPTQCAWRNNRALVWIDKKDYDKAIADYDDALRLFPQYALGYRNRGHCWLKKKEYEKALKDFEKGIELGPDIPAAHSSLARLLATCPDEKFRDGKRALEAAQKAVALSAWQSGSLLDTLAAAHAEVGQFDEAVKLLEKAFTDPSFLAEKEKADEARLRLQGYREKKPFRDEQK